MSVRQTRCPRCGQTFGCGADLAGDGPGCWCGAIPPLLEKTGEDCLCPACLTAAVARQALPTDSGGKP